MTTTTTTNTNNPLTNNPTNTFWLKVVELDRVREGDFGWVLDTGWFLVATLTGTTDQLVHWEEFTSEAEAVAFMKVVARAGRAWSGLDPEWWSARRLWREEGYRKAS